MNRMRHKGEKASSSGAIARRDSIKLLWLRPVILFMAALILAGCAAAPWSGPQDNFGADPSPIHLSNGLVYLTVAPRIGRVVAFGRVGEPSVLWMNPSRAREANGWRNYGGGRFWPTQQALWKVIFPDHPAMMDPAIDGDPWQVVEQDSRHITIQSSVCRALGVVVRRRFTLAEDRPEVTICNTVTRVASSPFPVMAWSIAQVKPSDHVKIVLAPDRLLPQRSFINYRQGHSVTDRIKQSDGILEIDPSVGSLPIKIGAFGTAIVAVWRFIPNNDSSRPSPTIARVAIRMEPTWSFMRRNDI